MGDTCRMNDSKRLITPRELDRQLSYPQGRSVRLARTGQIPHVLLPDGEIRFSAIEIATWLQGRSKAAPEASEGSR